MRCYQSPDYIAETRAYFQERLDRLRETLTEVGFDPYPTPGGMYLLCRAPKAVGGVATTTAQAAADVLLDEFDVAVMAWDRPPHGYLRFSSLYSAEDLRSLGELGDRLFLEDGDHQDPQAVEPRRAPKLEGARRTAAFGKRRPLDDASTGVDDRSVESRHVR